MSLKWILQISLFIFYFSSKKLLNFYRYLDDTESYIESERKVVKEEKPQVLGIITLEDIIESALKEDILDEGDYDVENNAYLNFKADKSEEAEKPDPKPTNKNLHQILQQKVINRLEGKQTGYNNQENELKDLKDILLDSNSKATTKADI